MKMPSAIEWLTVGPEAAALLAQLHDDTFTNSQQSSWSEADFRQILSLATTGAVIALLPASHKDKKNAAALPVGFVIFSRVLDECEILTLGVTPDRRKSGIGHRLLDTVIEKARDAAVKSIFLEVREDNQAAIHLYQQHGFTLTGRRRGYYPLNNGQHLDAILMHKYIA